jgi:hypothetical protein
MVLKIKTYMYDDEVLSSCGSGPVYQVRGVYVF